MWKSTTDQKPLRDCHGSMRCITYWPLHALHDDGYMTDRVVGGRQHIVDYTACGGDHGRFEDPDTAEAVGDWFGDDHCYAGQPSHWMPIGLNPDGTDTALDVTHVRGQPVENVLRNQS